MHLAHRTHVSECSPPLAGIFQNGVRTGSLTFHEEKSDRLLVSVSLGRPVSSHDGGLGSMLGTDDSFEQGGSMMNSEGEPQSMSDVLDVLKAEILDQTGHSSHFKRKLASDPVERQRVDDFDAGAIAVESLDANAYDTVASLGNLVAASARHVTSEENDQQQSEESEPSPEGPRTTFISLLNDVERGHAFGLWSDLNLSATAVRQATDSISEAIVGAVMSLLENPEGAETGHEAVNEAERKHINLSVSDSDASSSQAVERRGRETTLSAELPEALPTLLVWASSQDARRAIIHHALAARYGSLKQVPIGAAMAGAPLVLVVREKKRVECSLQELYGKEYVDDSQSEGTDGHETGACGAWRAACLGMAIIYMLEVDLLADIAVAVDAKLSREHAESNLAPVLVVIQTDHESTITAQSLALRKVCDRHGARMHLEGPSLMAVASIDESLDAVVTFQSYNTMLLEPAAWFGVGSCAVTTFHQADSGLVVTQTDDLMQTVVAGETAGSFRKSSTGPLFGLWTLLKRLGLYQARSIVSGAIRMSLTLASELRKVPNISCDSCGLGSTIKITYVMSRSERLIRKYKAREEVSRVNKALFQEVVEEFSPLQIRLAAENEQAWLVFSASRLVESMPFNIPGEASVFDFAKRLSETATKYEMSCIGSSPYTSRVCRLSDYQVVTEEEVGVSCVLSYGAFRIVPEEFDSSWQEDEAKFAVVHGLTSRLAETLAERTDHHNNTGSLGQGNQTVESPHRGTIGRSSRYNLLPFEFFLHSNNPRGVPDFLTVETRDAGRSKNPINEATMAAEFVVSCVSQVCKQWREATCAPVRSNALANVAGLEAFGVDDHSRRSKGQEDRPTDSGRTVLLNRRRKAKNMSQSRETESQMSQEPRLERDDDVEGEGRRQTDDLGDRERYESFSNSLSDPSSPNIPHHQSEAMGEGDENGGLEQSLGGSPRVRSHWYGSSSGAGRRNQKRRGNERENRRQNSDSSESSEEDLSESENSKSGDDLSESNSDNSSSGEESSEEDENSNGRKLKLRKKERASRDESEEESDGSDSEESEDRRESASGGPDTSSNNPPARRGLLSWLRGHPSSQPAVAAESLDGSESSFASASDGHSRTRRGNSDRLGSESDSKDSGSRASTSDISDGISGRGASDADYSDEDSLEEERKEKGPSPREEGVSRFGFNWLSKRVLPDSAGASEAAPSSRSHSRAPEKSRTGAAERRNSKMTVAGKRSVRSRRYSSTSSEAESSQSASRDYSDEESESSCNSGSARGSQGRRANAGRSKAPAPTRGWFSRASPAVGNKARAPRNRASEERRHERHSRQSFAGSFSSESSEYEERSATRRHPRNGQSKTPTSGSSVMSWLGGSTGERRARTTTKAGSSHRRR